MVAVTTTQMQLDKRIYIYIYIYVYIKDDLDNLLHTDFIILLNIYIPIIHRQKKLSCTRFKPHLVEVLGWHYYYDCPYLVHIREIRRGGR